MHDDKKITEFDGYPAGTEWFNWEAFRSILVILDKGRFCNLAFRVSVTHKWVIPQAHYMPVRAAEPFMEVARVRDRRIF